MRIHVLSSGSHGNVTIVETRQSSLIVDAGLSAKRIDQYLNEHRIPKPQALLLTHAHHDHVAFAKSCARAFNVPILTTTATADAINVHRFASFQNISPGQTLKVGEVVVSTSRLTHDAEQLGLFFSVQRSRAALITDLGSFTPSLIKQLRLCDLVMLESNHDEQMLWSGSYPWSIKKRVASDVGHLSNSQCASILKQLDTTTRCVVLMHLSQKNNSSQLALHTAKKALDPSVTVYAAGHSPVEVDTTKLVLPASQQSTTQVKSKQLSLF